MKKISQSKIDNAAALLWAHENNRGMMWAHVKSIFHYLGRDAKKPYRQLVRRVIKEVVS